MEINYPLHLCLSRGCECRCSCASVLASTCTNLRVSMEKKRLLFIYKSFLLVIVFVLAVVVSYLFQIAAFPRLPQRAFDVFSFLLVLSRSPFPSSSSNVLALFFLPPFPLRFFSSLFSHSFLPSSSPLSFLHDLQTHPFISSPFLACPTNPFPRTCSLSITCMYVSCVPVCVCACPRVIVCAYV